MTDTRHIKLVGGSLKTAKHDLEKIRTAKSAVESANRAELARAQNRKERA